MTAALKQKVSQDFSLVRLERLLSLPFATLRHDVDYDVDCALKMAQFEAARGVRSTYYIRPDGDYDVFSKPILRIVKRIAKLGHEIAPHVDLFAKRQAILPDEYVRLCCEHDFDLMRPVLPVTRKVSFHAPPRSVLWKDVPGFEHAMSLSWYGWYIADSRGVFKHTPEDWAEKPFQLNLHPEWWFWPEEVAAEWRQIEAVKP